MRSLKNKPQVIAPTSTYPHGRIKDDDGTGTVGTPVDEQVYGDFHQFFSQLMVDGGLTPNEIAENEYDGFQLNNALALFINQLIAKALPLKILNIGDWNMDTTATVSVPHGLTASKIITVDVIIFPDNGTGLDTYPLNWNIDGATNGGGIFSWDGTNIKLSRIATGIFDNVNFDATSFNRGIITIRYTL